MVVTRYFRRRQDAVRGKRAPRFRPLLEPLEDRYLLSGAVFTVANVNDSGPGSLRDALAQASDGDTVNFAPALVGQTITLSSGALTVFAAVTVQGPGAGLLTVNGGGLDHVFLFDSSGATLAGLTVTGGDITGSEGYGGGIENDGTLTLQGVVVTGNQADANGGGVVSFGDSLTVLDSTITGNTAGGSGGGIAALSGSLTVQNSTITGNTAGGNGGGLTTQGTSLLVQNSTIATNTAGGSGGGVATFGGFSSFAALQGSGGSSQSSLAFFVQASTIVGNQAGDSGGIYTASAVELDSSIVAGNTGLYSADLGGTVQSDGYNLVQNPGESGFSSTPTDVIGQDPQLAPLNNYGGPTRTYALTAASPARGTGDPALAGTLDQRGTTRPAAPDIGAFEAAAPVTFLLDTLPTVMAGTSFSLNAVALDAAGNVATAYTGTVRLSSSDAQAALPADVAFAAADLGLHTLGPIVLKTAGAQTVTASDTVQPSISGTDNIAVTAATATGLAFTTPPTATAGAPFTLTVAASDPYGNPDPNYRGTLHFSGTDAQGSLPADYSFTAADAGTHTFTSVVLVTAGAQTISVGDLSQSAFAASANVTVNAAAATQLTLTAPATATAGAAFALTVTARDPFGNVDPNYLGTVHFSSTDPAAGLPADYTFNANDAGAHTFSGAFLATAGAPTVAVADAAGSVSGTTTIQVSPGPTARLLVTGLPGSLSAGVSATLTVTAQDAFGNLTPAYTGTVSFRSSDSAATLPADYPFTTADGGSHRFAVALATTGDQSVTVSDSTGAAGTTANTTVTPLALVLTRQGRDSVLVGEQVTLDLSGSQLAGVTITGFNIDWGDGTVDTFDQVPAQATHVYLTGPRVNTVAATASYQSAGGTGTLSASLNVLVVPPTLAVTAFDTALPGKTIRVQVPGAIGITGDLFNDPGTPNAILLVGVYGANPTPIQLGPGVFYDAVVENATDGDSLTLEVNFPAGSVMPTLLYFDPATGNFVPVHGSTQTTDSLQVDAASGVIRVVLDRTSSPNLLALTGTVFAVSVPTTPPPTSTTVVTPQASSAPTTGSTLVTPSTTSTSSSSLTSTSNVSASLVLGNGSGSTLLGGNGNDGGGQASFQSTGTLTLALAPSQNSALAARAGATLVGGGQPTGQGDLAVVVELVRQVLEAVPQVLRSWAHTDDLMQMLRRTVAPPAPASTQPSVRPAQQTQPGAAVDQVFIEAANDPAEDEEGAVASWLWAAPLLGLVAAEPRRTQAAGGGKKRRGKRGRGS